ncbi:MAG TPA: hypothetical protein VFE14_04725, partial [Micromonosporaceae bacterium]|nr:hypothetical protein [Micromonosporaceae bacterium]
MSRAGLSPPPRSSRRAAAKPGRVAAQHLPIARVSVDVAVPHLDRPFDYLVPAEADAQAQPGTRLRVRFSG